jgi:hypothetical protein
MQRGSLRAHEEVCPRAPVLCAAEDGGCRWAGPRAEQDAHEATCMWGRAEAPSMRTQVYIVATMTSHIGLLACHCYPPDPILLLVARQFVTLLDLEITVAWKVAPG